LFEVGSSFAPVRRDEIVGIEGLLDRFDEVVGWLRNAQWFAKHGSRLEPGILLAGEPGTGKTMIARYLATCSNALFVAVRDFPTASEVLSAADVADLFARARQYYAKNDRPVLIFWDEIEIHAKRRMEITARDASVVSQLMSELDGVHGKCTGILFVGCTNHPTAIDPALRRHGRLGRQFDFVAPDRLGKMRLLEHYLGQHSPVQGIDLEAASYYFPSEATASTIEEACERVWCAVLHEHLRKASPLVVTQDVLNDVLLEELLGPPPPYSNIDNETLRRVALHELGHALVAKALTAPIQIMTIRPGASTFGRVITVSEEERGMFNAEQHRKQIAVGLGSLAMENYLGLVVSSGIDGDTSIATKLAVALVEKLAQHSWRKFGPVNVEALKARSEWAETPITSSALMEYYDYEVSRVLVEGYDRAYAILAGIGKPMINALADRWMVDRTWTGRQFDRIYDEVAEKLADYLPTVPASAA